jgi:hypothetical protein
LNAKEYKTLAIRAVIQADMVTIAPSDAGTRYLKAIAYALISIAEATERMALNDSMMLAEMMEKMKDDDIESGEPGSPESQG